MATYAKVLLLRPQQQAQSLISALNEHGITAVSMPTITINFLATAKLRQQLAMLADFDYAIFVSANAVTAAMRMLSGYPQLLKTFAIGNATKATLAEYGVVATVAPPPYNSEALLTLPDFIASPKKIALIKGEGGRDYLFSKLLEYGHIVENICCYQRLKPQIPSTTIDDILIKQAIEVIIATSNETLQNLWDLSSAKSKNILLTKKMVVFSNRAAELARDLGFSSKVAVAAAATEAELIATIVRILGNDNE